MTDDSSPQSRTFANEPRPVLPGDVVAGKYVVERIIGTGGMGQVVAARHETLGTHVAIKLIHASEASDPEIVERFKREALLMAKLRGDHLVRVHDVGETEYGVPFIIMDFLEGKDLAALTRAAGGKLPFDAVLDYAIQACEALAEVHDVGIVHRDLKPSNLFLAKSPSGKQSIRVLDFGIAKQRSEKRRSFQLTTQGSIVGTLQYMAPEQIDGSAEVDPRTDVWGLGSCLYRILTGRLAFPSSSEAELSAAIFGSYRPPAPHELVPDIPPALSAIVLRCLERDPARRFPSMRELGAALEALRKAAIAPPPPSFSKTLPLAQPAPSFSLPPPSVPVPVARPVSAPPAPTTTGHGPSPVIGIAIGLLAACLIGVVGALVIRAKSTRPAQPVIAVEAPTSAPSGAPSVVPRSTQPIGVAQPTASTPTTEPSTTRKTTKRPHATASASPSSSAPPSKDALYDDL